MSGGAASLNVQLGYLARYFQAIAIAAPAAAEAVSKFSGNSKASGGDEPVGVSVKGTPGSNAKPPTAVDAAPAINLLRSLHAAVVNVTTQSVDLIANSGATAAGAIEDAGRRSVDYVEQTTRDVTNQVSDALQELLAAAGMFSGQGASAFGIVTKGKDKGPYGSPNDQEFTNDPNKVARQGGGFVSAETALIWGKKVAGFIEYMKTGTDPFKLAEANRGIQQYSGLFRDFFPQMYGGDIMQLARDLINATSKATAALNRPSPVKRLLPRAPAKSSGSIRFRTMSPASKP